MTTPALEKAAAETIDSTNVEHWWCCDPKRALCGAEIDGDWSDEYDDSRGPEDCVVCVELYMTATCHGVRR